MSLSMCVRLIPLLSIFAGCGGYTPKPLEPWEGPWDLRASDRAYERGFADGKITFEGSRISVPAGYTECWKSGGGMWFVYCSQEYYRGQLPTRQVKLGQQFLPKAQLEQAGQWPVDPEEFLDQTFKKHAKGRIRRSNLVAQEDLPSGAKACIRFHYRLSQRPPQDKRTDYQFSGLYCVRRTEEPLGVLAVLGVMSESVDRDSEYGLTPGFDDVSEPVLRTLKFTNAKLPEYFGEPW